MMIFMNGTNRAGIKSGLQVLIVLRPDQRTGKQILRSMR
jgi:uncharacterized protein YwbE